MRAYLIFGLQKENGPVFIKPGEIVSFSKAPQGGTRVVTRQNQIFYVEETVKETDQLIIDFFDEIYNEKGEF